MLSDRWGTLSGGDGASAHPPGARIPQGSFSFDPTADEPVETLTAGDPSADRDPYYTGQHTLSLWNDASARWFGLTILGLEHGLVLDWRGELASGEYVSVEFERADQFLVTLHVETVDDSWYWLGSPNGRSTATVPVPPSLSGPVAASCVAVRPH